MVVGNTSVVGLIPGVVSVFFVVGVVAFVVSVFFVVVSDGVVGCCVTYTLI